MKPFKIPKACSNMLIFEEKWKNNGAGTFNSLLERKNNFDKSCQCEIDAYDKYCLKPMLDILTPMYNSLLKILESTTLYYILQMCTAC